MVILSFCLIFIKLFYIGNIKIITNSPKPKPIPKLYNKAKGNTGMISFTIPAILLKHNRECPYKNPDFIVFL